MVRNFNEFKETPPVGQQQQGFNPFANMFGNYFGNNGGFGGGGVPDGSSGFRYRNKRRLLEKDLQEGVANNAFNANSGNPALADVDTGKIQGEIDTLGAERDSYQAGGLASGLPGIFSTGMALYNNYEGLKRLNGVNPESYISQESKDIAAAAALAKNSAQTADAAQRKADINSNTNMAIANAQTAATSPDQVQQVALMAQKQANMAVNDLGQDGLVSMDGRKKYSDQLNMNLGNMRQKVKAKIESEKAVLREAMARNTTQLFENIGTTALTMGV